MKHQSKIISQRNAQRATHNDKTKNKFIAHYALRIARIKVLILAVLILPVHFGGQCLADQPVMKTLSAHVLYVAEDGISIAVDFRHPATDKVHRLIFYTDGESGLSGMKSLRDLRAGQVVSIDYVENPSGKKMIRRIAKVKLSGPPPGLENFNGI